MRRLPLLFASLAAAALSGCGARRVVPEPPGPDLRRSDLPAEGPAEGRASFGEPIRLPGQSVLLIPFAFERAGRFTDAFRSAPASRSLEGLLAPPGPSLQPVYWQNLVFVDPAAGAAPARALLDERAVIVRFAALRAPGSRSATDPADTLVYGVVTEDTDGDGRLHAEDGVAVWVSTPTGEAARPVTPGNARLEGVEADAGSGSIFLRLRRDEDGDGVVTTLDPARTWVLDRPDDATAGSPARPLIDPALAERMQSLLR